MNLRSETENFPVSPIRPGGRNLLYGLTGRRLIWALLINSVVAVLGAQEYLWTSVQQAMVSAQLVGLSIMLSWTIASNLRLRWLPSLVAQMLSVVVGSVVGTALVALVKSFLFD